MLEKNNIYLGGAYSLIKEIEDKSIDLIITDPPYDFGGMGGNSGLFKNRTGGYKVELEQNGLHKGFDFNILNEFIRVLKKSIYMYGVIKTKYMTILSSLLKNIIAHLRYLFGQKITHHLLLVDII